MKHTIITALLFLGTLLQAQTMRFVYQATTTPDSTDASSKKNETVYLDTDGKKSFFYAENRVKRDSVFERMRSTRTFDPSQIENLRSNINYIVEKDYATQTTTFKDRIGRDQYAYTETTPISWKILPETVTIGEYKTQKAEASFGGRTWEVWFTMDLPYQDGPYKFSGLPGLIIKAQDEKGDYTFDLMQVKKIAEIPTLQQRGQDISLSKDKYKKTLAAFRKDPEGYMNANQGMRGGPGGGIAPPQSRSNSGGGPNSDRMKEMRERMLKEIRSNNNPIELK